MQLVEDLIWRARSFQAEAIAHAKPPHSAWIMNLPRAKVRYSGKL